MAELFGRDHYLSTLRSELRRAFEGRGGLVLVSGEPGIGKTSLLDHCADHASELGGRPAWGTCWEGAGAPVLWPWQRVLHTLDPDNSDVMANLQRDVGIGARDPGQFALFTAVSDHLRDQSRLSPLLVVLDDLQWADTGCLRLLRFLARDLHADSVLLAGAYRGTGLADGHALRELAAASGTVHLELSGLTRGAVAALLTEVTGAAPGAAEVARVTERTAGNPFFVREVGRLMLADPHESRLPAAVEDAVAARILSLPDTTVGLLCTASLIGRLFEDDVLARAQGLTGAASAACLAPALEERLVETAEEGCHRFVHDLVREHLEAGLGFDERRDAHRRLARAIEGLPRLPMRSARLAAHAAAAVPNVPASDAAAWCRVAAAEATAAQGHDDAVRHLRAAVRLTRTPGGGANLELELELADALRRAGRLGEARQLYERLADLAASEGSTRGLALAALGQHECGAESQTPRATLITTLEAARAGLGKSGDRPLLARVTAALARALADGPDAKPDRAGALADEAIAVARAVDNPGLLAACLFARHDAIWGPGTAEERRDLGDEQCRVATGHAADLAFQGALCRYVALLEMGDPAAAPALADVEERADATGQPVLRYLSRSRRDGWDAMLGTPGVEERITESFELGTRLEVPDAFGVFVTQLVTIDVGRPDAPAAIQARQRRIGGRLMPPDYLVEERSMELLAEGDRAAAATLLSSALPPGERTLFRWRALAAMAFGVEAGWRAGAADVCARAYDDLLPHAGELIVIGGGVSIVGPADLYLGLAAEAAGEHDLAAQHFAAALSQSRVLGARPWVERLTALLEGASFPTATGAGFRLDGDVWRLEYAGTTAHLPDAKGLRDIALLLARPGQSVPAIVLAGGDASHSTGADPVLDDAARTAYRRRIEVLDATISEARDDGDEARLAFAEGERDAIIAELRAATGLAGRRRRLGDPGERARSAVTARIKEAVRRIAAVNPALAAHLRESLRTGRSCVYQPSAPVNWSL